MITSRQSVEGPFVAFEQDGAINRVTLTLIATLALMLATMHHNFLGARPLIAQEYSTNIALVVHQQLDFAAGRYAQSAPIDQSRLLVPFLFSGLYHVAPWSWEAPTFLVAEWLVNFFSLFILYLLARKIMNSTVGAMATVLLMCLYVPFGFAGVTRVGEAALFGIYCAIVLAALAERPALFVTAIIIGSLQRPDISLCAAAFGVAHFLYSERDRTAMRVLLTCLSLLLPVLVLAVIKSTYHLAEMSEFTDGLAQRLRWNLKDTRILVLAYAPLLAGTFLLKVRFDPTIKRMLLFSIVPWLSLNTFMGNFSETRRFFPVIAVVLIGLVQCLVQQWRLGAGEETIAAGIALPVFEASRPDARDGVRHA